MPPAGGRPDPAAVLSTGTATLGLIGSGDTGGTLPRLAVHHGHQDDEATATVAALVDDFGSDVVDLGPLAEGWRVQRSRDTA